uniref:Uncharacterized protein n=1 Tax=Rhizophora mucronata TaxID=61149 RepID=A0A2P2LLC2_RHIMU
MPRQSARNDALPMAWPMHDKSHLF